MTNLKSGTTNWGRSIKVCKFVIETPHSLKFVQNELPPKLVEKIIKYSSNTGDKVMDMFLGGFTTARVGLELGREPLGFEVNNKSFNHFYPRFHLKR